jgi:hypothetical protein
MEISRKALQRSCRKLYGGTGPAAEKPEARKQQGSEEKPRRNATDEVPVFQGSRVGRAKIFA